MSQSTPSVLRPVQRILAALTVGCALGLAVVQAPALQAQTAPAAAAKTLPLKPSFKKSKDAEAGPYVLSLKNTSTESLKVSGSVLLAVYFHATDKARALPEETIAPGKSWKIKDLSTDDKITIKADGYEPLTLSVPGKKK